MTDRGQLGRGARRCSPADSWPAGASGEEGAGAAGEAEGAGGVEATFVPETEGDFVLALTVSADGQQSAPTQKLPPARVVD